MFAHLRVALAGSGGSGGRCEWKLRSREAGSATTQARKACREAKPSHPPPAKGRLSSKCQSSLLTLLARAMTPKGESQHRGLPRRSAPLGKPA
jgi:hypothetical protein